MCCCESAFYCEENPFSDVISMLEEQDSSKSKVMATLVKFTIEVIGKVLETYVFLLFFCLVIDTFVPIP